MPTPPFPEQTMIMCLTCRRRRATGVSAVSAMLDVVESDEEMDFGGHGEDEMTNPPAGNFPQVFGRMTYPKIIVKLNVSRLKLC